MGSRLKYLALLLAVVGFTAAPAFADAFTDNASFQAAIAGFTSNTASFDDLAANTVIPQGGTADGITFPTYSLGEVPGTGNLMVSSLFDTTSFPNYLGSDDGGTNAFFHGDSITMSFASPINALGMYIIIGGDPSANDFTLSGGSATAFSSTDLQSFPSLNGLVLFLGITSTTDFSSATISMDKNAADYVWNLDDVVSATAPTSTTPEPGTLLLLTTGLGVFLRRIRKS